MKSRNLKIFLILIFIIFLTGCRQKEDNDDGEKIQYKSNEYLSWSVKMADSEMERRGNSLAFGGSNPKAKWQYTTGLFLKSMLDLWQVTNDSKYFEYVKNVMDSFIEENGSIKTYKMTEYNLDKINPGKVLLSLYKKTGSEKYKLAADILYQQLQNQPRTLGGGFWHKQIYPWQMWLDGIYMSSPFYARYGALFDRPDAFEDVIKQIKLIDARARDVQTGLRYHAWDESNNQDWADPETGCSPHFWGRAVGWYSMALVDVLDYLPAQNQDRNQIIYILGDLLKAVKKYQDKSGLWFQIIDLGERPGNYLETSCSAMFVYSMAKAVHKGYVDTSYRETAIKGYNGLIKKMITEDSDKRINLNGVCSVAGLGGDPYRDGSFEYYISEPVVANDLKGVGPFIMAGIQMYRLEGGVSE